MKNSIFSLYEKTAIITGGCGWLGFKMAQILAEYGANVIINISGKIKRLKIIFKAKY